MPREAQGNTNFFCVKPLSQEKLGFKAKIHRNYVSLLELDRKSPTVEILFRICKAMRIKPSELIAEVEDKWKPKRR